MNRPLDPQVAGMIRALVALGHAEEEHLAGVRFLPDGRGWCRPVPAPEETWPPGANLCVVLNLYPDERYRRNPDTGKVPRGAAKHWKERIDATTADLEAAGYTAEQRTNRTPEFHWHAELLVYRMREGLSASRQPPLPLDAPPAEPNYSRHANHWHDPTKAIQDALADADLARINGRDRPVRVGLGCLVINITQTLWVPGAGVCGLVRWYPDPPYAPRGDGSFPTGAREHWDSAAALTTQALRDRGYLTRPRERSWDPAVDEYAGFLVHGPPAGRQPADGPTPRPVPLPMRKGGRRR
jgi:hypothetical protein